MDGRVERIHLVATSGGEPDPVERVEAVAGAGLRGDRYFDDSSGSARAGSDLTLVASEALAAVERDHGIDLDRGEHRRNVTVAGVDLDALVGERFRVGDAVCVGTGPCEPCAYLADRLDEPGTTEALAGRGGLRCRIVDGGRIDVGDPVGSWQ
ncbi:MOSC domain-containing protein [Halosimplex carlsbadense 2-9-1]|uniref:MOSC domain-containing protein n=1 Tax=Halosimplex carlsbadense 2-9-1 TaxID=797114 RepID=M0D6C2_9EURY|nr:MOSC domain-containing protein [Halosimplex carlsbadense]ELZ30247.1 MOSC domain-containing protein [Halosimplex carlsbadense 2-9-1]